MSELARREERQAALAQASQEIVRRIREPQFLEQLQLALPPAITPERFVRAAATAFFINPELAEASTQSILLALLRCAHDGLTPDGQHAALVVYNDRKSGGKTASYLPMVGGLIDAAGEHGWTIRAEVVREHDDFLHEEGLEPVLKHHWRPDVERGEIIAAYAIANHRDGRRQHRVLYAADIAKLRARAKTDGFWEAWPERMAEKSAVKALVKRLSLDSYDERVLRLLAADETAGPEAVEQLYGPEATKIFPEQPVAADEGDAQPPQEPTPTASDVAAEGEPFAAAGSPEAAAAQPAPPEPEPEPAPEDALLQQAGSAVVPKGLAVGLTLTEVAEKEDGEDWFKMALELDPERWGDNEFVSRLRFYARLRYPHLVPADG